MTRVKKHYEWGEVDDLLAGGGPPTPDDVSITADGRRLDSAEAVIEFFEDLQAERDAAGADDG